MPPAPLPPGKGKERTATRKRSRSASVAPAVAVLVARACPRAQEWQTSVAMQSPFLVLVVLLAALTLNAANVGTFAQRIAPLIDPAKLATLGERGANPRVQKYVAALAEAQAAGLNPSKVSAQAVKLAGYQGDAATLTADAMVRNLDIAQKLGALDAEGLDEMRRGNAATVKTGPYKGQQLSVDHVIPRSVVPGLDNVIANLELMPAGLNSAKGAKIGDRQRSLARKLNKAGLLSASGLRAIGTAK